MYAGFFCVPNLERWCRARKVTKQTPSTSTNCNTGSGRLSQWNKLICIRNNGLKTSFLLYLPQKHPQRPQDKLESREQVAATSLPTNKLVGDNINKSIKPRHMRIKSQTHSLHYFHSYVVKDRVAFWDLDDNPSLPNFNSNDVTEVPPTLQEVAAIKSCSAFM